MTSEFASSRFSVLKGTAALAVSSLALAAPAGAETLRLGHILPAGHYIQTQMVEVFTNAVSEAMGGELTFEIYPSGQVGTDMVAATNGGLLDLAVVITGRQPEIFPLTSVGELPQAANSACEGTERMWQLTQPGALLDQLEFATNGQRVLAASMLAPYVLYTHDHAVRSLADAAGLKIWASGPAAENVISAIGAVPIRIPSPEVYDAATRGTVDGAVFPYSGLIQYDLAPVLNNVVEGIYFGSGVFFLTISTEAWDGLSTEQQVIVTEAGHAAQAAFCSYLDTSDAEQRAQVAAIEGYTVVTLEPEAFAEFSTSLSSVAETWAANLDAAGRAGTEVLDAYRATAGQ